MATEDRLRIAVMQLKRRIAHDEQPPRVTVAAVARLANVHPSTIHTRHPQILNEIRALQGLAPAKQPLPNVSEAESMEKLRKENAELRRILAAQSSRLASVEVELAGLRRTSKKTTAQR